MKYVHPGLNSCNLVWRYGETLNIIQVAHKIALLTKNIIDLIALCYLLPHRSFARISIKRLNRP